MERTFKPRLPQITSGELELHEPNSSSQLVIASSRVQWNAALDARKLHRLAGLLADENSLMTCDGRTDGRTDRELRQPLTGVATAIKLQHIYISLD